MSKMDDMRAMREARCAAITARAGKAPATRSAPAPVAPPAPGKGAAKKTPAKKVATKKPAETPAAAASEELCGHRAISGRTCTREQGHAAKSHRYS